jgi:hypothetical protein
VLYPDFLNLFDIFLGEQPPSGLAVLPNSREESPFIFPESLLAYAYLLTGFSERVEVSRFVVAVVPVPAEVF